MDQFSKTLELHYPKDALWDRVEWWQQKVFERFRAAGYEGRTTQTTAFWAEGGHSERPIARHLQDFASAEHLEPRSVSCTVKNGTYLDSTLEVLVRADFKYAVGVSLEVKGSVKQQVYGLHAELLLEKEAEESRLANEAKQKSERESATLEPPAQEEAKSRWGQFGKIVAPIAAVVAIVTFFLKIAGVF